MNLSIFRICFFVLMLGTFARVQANDKPNPYMQLLLTQDLLPATYVSTEYDSGRPLPHWIRGGEVVTTAEAAITVENGGIVCTLWALDYTPLRGQQGPEQVKAGALASSPLPLWLDTGYGRIFLNPVTEFALSPVCVKKNEQNQVAEVYNLSYDEWNRIFRGLVLFQGE